MDYLYPLLASHSSGEIILLYSYDELISFIKKYGRFTEHHVSYYYDPNYYLMRRESNGWIVRDDSGKVVKFDDIKKSTYSYYNSYYNNRMAKIREMAAKGLPIPGTGGFRKCWKMNHQAKKNSGARKRNRLRSICEEHYREYGVKNPYGKVRKFEGW